MDLFVYSDESGVFDPVHNAYFVFGGLLFIGKEQKDEANHKYIHAERCIKDSSSYASDFEMKASNISNREKSKLFRSMNKFYKFGVVVKQNKVNENILKFKKSKQRYLDYVYKIALKRLLETLILKKVIDRRDIDHIRIYADEHTTATDGRYELREALLQEFKYGTFNKDFSVYYNPIIPGLKDVELKQCNSSRVNLVRAADIVANRIYHAAISNTIDDLRSDSFIITIQP